MSIKTRFMENKLHQLTAWLMSSETWVKYYSRCKTRRVSRKCCLRIKLSCAKRVKKGRGRRRRSRERVQEWDTHRGGLSPEHNTSFCFIASTPKTPPFTEFRSLVASTTFTPFWAFPSSPWPYRGEEHEAPRLKIPKIILGVALEHPSFYGDSRVKHAPINVSRVLNKLTWPREAEWVLGDVGRQWAARGGEKTVTADSDGSGGPLTVW